MPILDNRLGFVVNVQQVALDGDAPVKIFDRGVSEGPRNRTEEDRSERIRYYQCDWALSTEPAIRALVGYPKTMAANGGNYVRRYVPHSIADWTISHNLPLAGANSGTPYLYCTSTEDWALAPVGSAGRVTDNVPAGEKVPIFDTTNINATYQTLPYDVLTDTQLLAKANGTDPRGNPDESCWKRYCLVNPKPAGEFFSIPSGYMNWVASPAQPVVFGLGKLLVYANLAVTRFGVPATSMPTMHVNPNLTAPGALDLAMGTVNSTKLNNYDAELLLLTAADIRPKRSAFGLRVYDYTTYHKFVCNHNAPFYSPVLGHNHFFRPRLNPDKDGTPGAIVGQWVEVSLGGASNVTQTDGVNVYNYFDHHLVYRDP